MEPVGLYPEGEPVGAEPGWQPAHCSTRWPLQRFQETSNAAAAEQSAGETSAKAVSDSRQSSLGVFRTLEYVMQGDSLIFSVINHFSNRQNYCTVCNASLVLLRLGLSVAQILHR